MPLTMKRQPRQAHAFDHGRPLPSLLAVGVGEAPVVIAD